MGSDDPLDLINHKTATPSSCDGSDPQDPAPPR